MRVRVRACLARLRERSTSISLQAVNVGSGPHWAGLPFWASYDLELGQRFTELSKLPYEDNSIEKIFSSHFVEHLTLREARNFLEEAFRVMKPGAVLRIVCPDIESLSRAVTHSGLNPTPPLALSRPSGWGDLPIELCPIFFVSHLACHYEERVVRSDGSFTTYRRPPPIAKDELREILTLDVSLIHERLMEKVPEKMRGSILHKSCWGISNLGTESVSAGFQFEKSSYLASRSLQFKYLDYTHGRRSISLWADLLKPNDEGLGTACTT